MMKTAVVRARVEPALKKRAERVLAAMGLDISESIRLYLREITVREELPFPLRTPNAASRRALKEARSGKLKSYDDREEFYKAVGLK